MRGPDVVVDHTAQTACSDPGPWAALVTEVEPTIAAVSAMARNVVAHYRAQEAVLPAATRGDVDLRWVEAILGADQARHGTPLTAPRPVAERVQGCCRDHTLLSVAALRAHGVPARSRVGFAGYLSRDDWHHDHVIVEAWLDGAWRRFDPEFDATPAGPAFETAAEVWLGHRRGELDVERYGVAAGLGLGGDWFVHGYVIAEVAHRFGDELLLWDQWGAMTGDLATAPPDRIELVDEVAGLLVQADGGDVDAERTLLARYRADDRLHPGPRLHSFSPSGARTVVDLARRTTEPFEIGPGG